MGVLVTQAALYIPLFLPAESFVLPPRLKNWFCCVMGKGSCPLALPQLRPWYHSQFRYLLEMIDG